MGGVFVGCVYLVGRGYRGLVWMNTWFDCEGYIIVQS